MAKRESKNTIKYFSAPSEQWKSVIGFFLVCSLVGLQFYPALILVALLLLYRWRTDRYFFLVEFLILCTGSGFVRADALPFNLSDCAFLFGLIGIAIYRRSGLVKRITLFMFGYFAIIIGLALQSTEPMSHQLPQIRFYMLIIGIFIPLVTFANRDFDFERFMRVLTLHELVICGFYVVDTFIINGAILLPGADAWHISTYKAPLLFPLQFHDFIRHYPPGLYWLFLLIVPLNYGKLRLHWYQWALIFGAILASRTNTLLFALLVCFVFFRPKIKQVAMYAVIGVVVMAGLYVVDKATGGGLRISSTVEQFTSLDGAVDEEDLADFGTGRMAQIIPKWVLLEEMNREWVGFGFLSRTRTTNPIYQISNPLYSDQSQADEVATGVEVTEIQTIFDIGYIGLIAQLIFYIGLYYMVRHSPYAKYYLCMMVGMELMGIGGFAGLNGMHGTLLILGLILGAIILDIKQRATVAEEEACSESYM